MNSEHFPTCFINQRNGLHVEVEIPEDLRRLSEEAELAIFASFRPV